MSQPTYASASTSVGDLLMVAGQPTLKVPIPWWRSPAMWTSYIQVAIGVVLAGLVAQGWITTEQAGLVDVQGLFNLDPEALAVAVPLIINGIVGARGRRNGGKQPSPIASGLISPDTAAVSKTASGDWL